MVSKESKYWEVDVSRAILDSANAFGNLGKVGEEYLTNSLDAFETIIHDNQKTNFNRLDCKVKMIINVPKKEIIFEDRHELMGMPEEVIFGSFFKLHAENLARERFINVRGKYGTGKVAAFGINANYFILDTVYKGLRTTVKSAKKAFYEDKRPKLDVIHQSEKVKGIENGTTITISLANCKYITERSVKTAIKYLQKLFGRFLDMYFIEIVTIMSNYNTQEMRLIYNPPNAVYEKTYQLPDKYKTLLGDTSLIIKRAAETIEDEDQRGILISSNFYPKEQTYFGLDGKPYLDRYFGEWEIPLLDKHEGENPPTLSTRELRLNRDNEMVVAIYEFGKQVLDKEIKEFSENENARKKDETTKKLDKIARELTDLLNDDFSDYEEVKKTGEGDKGKSSKNGKSSISLKEEMSVLDKNAVVIKPGNDAAFIENENGELSGKIKNKGKGSNIENSNQTNKINFNKSDSDKKNGKLKNILNRPAGGGFTVKFEQLNHNDFIARVDKNTKIITVNLDADPIKVHLKNCKENIYDPTFRIFAYSAAIDEYSRYCIHTQADNGEFFGTAPEAAQEAADAIRDIKKRIFDNLAKVLLEADINNKT